MLIRLLFADSSMYRPFSSLSSAVPDVRATARAVGSAMVGMVGWATRSNVLACFNPRPKRRKQINAAVLVQTSAARQNAAATRKSFSAQACGRRRTGWLTENGQRLVDKLVVCLPELVYPEQLRHDSIVRMGA